MPSLPHQLQSFILPPSQSPPLSKLAQYTYNNQYSNVQPTFPMASIPRGMVDPDHDAYDAFQIDESPQPEPYDQNAQMSDAYGHFGAANFQYQSEPQPPDNLQGYWQPNSSHEISAAIRPLEHQLLRPSSSSQYHAWTHPSPSSPHYASTSGSNYSPQYRSPPGSSHSFGPYPTMQGSPGNRRSMSSELVPSPYTNPSQLSPPATPSAMPIAIPGGNAPNLDGYREQLKLFKEALQLPLSFNAGPFVPQKMYMPHTNSDRRRYVEEIDLQQPIYFWMEAPGECGIPLIDALHSRVRRLRHRDEPVFEGRGPSISVRIQWPGYRPWSRQIPTKDFRSPPQPITKAKLAKNIAKCVERFLSARTGTPLEDDVDPRWKVGPRIHEIKLEDLYLVSMHHVSMGSWQPHLRLRRPLPQ